MNKNSRTKNTLISASTGLLGYLVTYLVAFVYRTVFIHSLGKVYLGVEGLFSNILALLSLAELGISTAISFSLYKPLAENDKETIKSLMAYFKKFYIAIAAFIAVAGAILTPFIDFFIKEPPNIKEPLWLIYLLYLAGTVASYGIVYKQTLINADQKVYICSVIQNLTTILRSIAQIVWLITVGSFIPILVIQIVSQLLSNYVLAIKADKLYPFLRTKPIAPLDKTVNDSISKKIKALFLYKIGAVVVTGTDNILISKFIGIVQVGVYTNYNTLLLMAKTLTNFLIKAITPGVGNLSVTKTPAEGQRIFHELNFLVFYIFSLFTLEFAVLLNPFITLWIGSEYLLDGFTVSILLVNFYLYGMHQTQLIYRNVLGLYIYCRWKPVVEAVVNIGASLLFIRYCGLPGVFLGTFTSFMATAFWVEPYVLYKYYFKSSAREYCVNYLQYAVFATGVVSACKFATKSFELSTWVSVVMMGVVLVLIHAFLVFMVFRKKQEVVSSFRRIRFVVESIVKRKVR